MMDTYLDVSTICYTESTLRTYSSRRTTCGVNVRNRGRTGAGRSEIQAPNMKIAHVVDSMEGGGAETLVSQMCRLQREQLDDPCVDAVLSLGALGERMRKEGFAVQPHVGRHLPDATRNFFRIFKESRPDVVHLHNPTPTVYAAAAARLAGVPSIVSTDRKSVV